MTTHRSLTLAGLCLLAALFMTGCTLYLGPDDDDNWQDGGDGWSDDDWTQPPGFPCDSDAECAAGCYCTDAVPGDGVSGTCVESGYCTRDADCGAGMECDGGTCKPIERGCNADSQCPDGQACDETSRTCVPVVCDDDGDCASGSVCNEGTGRCEPTQGCTADDQCPDGTYCNEERGTCTPGVDPEAPTCGGTVSCNQNPPRCAAGHVPLIDPTTGCYTGTCEAIATCDTAPVCGHIRDEASCMARTDCEAVYNGRNCRMPDGTACQANVPGCICESFVFSVCSAN